MDFLNMFYRNQMALFYFAPVKLKRAYYNPEEYTTLREFYNLIVKKHNEQIVFKKKK